MPRVKGGVTSRRRHKKILALAKGYYGSKHVLYKTANEQVMKSLRYAYRDRRQLKREMRKLWIARINAAARMNGMSYSKLAFGLKIAGVNINRKMLSELAIRDEKAFVLLVEQAKSALNNQMVQPVPVHSTVEKVKPAAKSHQPAGATESLASMKVSELKLMAKEKGINGYSKMKKEELIQALSK